MLRALALSKGGNYRILRALALPVFAKKHPLFNITIYSDIKENPVKYESECISLYIAILKSGCFFRKHRYDFIGFPESGSLLEFLSTRALPVFAKKRPLFNIAIYSDMHSDSYFTGFSLYRYILLY